MKPELKPKERGEHVIIARSQSRRPERVTGVARVVVVEILLKKHVKSAAARQEDPRQASRYLAARTLGSETCHHAGTAE